MVQTACILADEVLTLYDSPWKRAAPQPAALVATQGKTRLFVLPSPCNSRGLPGRGVQPLKNAEYTDVLTLFADTDAVLVGLGHDPEQAALARTKLSARSPRFQTFIGVTIPIMQTGGAACVE